MEKNDYRSYKKTQTKVVVQACMYYLQGRCRFGPNCRYSHEGFTQALMIRHAESQFNKTAEQFPNQSFFQEPSKTVLHFNRDFIDCHLSRQGQYMCKQILLPAEHIGRERQVDIVFVSPLNRALETAQNMIKVHKLKPQKIIVLPELSEVLSKICDFSRQLAPKKLKYPSFDFSQMTRFVKASQFIQDEDHWQDLLVDQEYFSDILIKEKAASRYMLILQKIFPTPLQSSQRCFNRALQALEVMKELIYNFKAKRVIVVSHNRILKYLDGRFNKGRGSSFDNCEVRQLIF